MNETKGIRLLRWAVLLLVLCNIGLLATVWIKPHFEAGPGPMHGETPRDFVVLNLKFNEEQTKQYDIMVKEHQQAMKQLRHEAMDYRQQLFSNLANEGKAGNNPDSLARLIANNQQQIEMVTYRHFALVRALCTEGQKQIFDKIIGDVIIKMNGNMHPPGDRRGPPPEGHGPPPDREGPPHGPPPPDAP
jgi:periplasmic protein CpxP/Spy